MEFGLREWMILIGGLLILVVIGDGVRRVFTERRNTLRMSLSRGNRDGSPEDFNPELPNGGARAIGRTEFGDVRTQPRYPKTEAPAAISPAPVPGPVVAPAADAVVQEPGLKPEPEPELATGPEPAPKPEQAPEPELPQETVARSPAATLNMKPEEVLIINVLSRDNNGFNGADLLEVLLACDVRFGDRNIFHRYEGAQGQGRIQFSVANMVKPGTFDLDSIREFYTPGVSMFMQLPGPEDSLGAFNCMAETASCIVKNLQGEMRDDGHSVLTGQTLEHYRERIRDYERKRLMQAAHRSA